MTLIYLAIGWIAGILLAAFLKLPTPVWLVLTLLPLNYLALFWRNLLLRKWHFVLLCLILGALRYQFGLPSEPDQQLQQFNDQGRASLVGIVVAEPDVRETQTLLTLQVSKIQTDGAWQDTQGQALASVPRDTPVNYGDEVQVDGVPETPPDAADFSYRDYLARQDIFTLIRFARAYTITSGHGNPVWATLYQIKSTAIAAINQLLPEPSASLLIGILLGDANGMPTALRDAFANTNTAHIIAISGYNIEIVIIVLAFLFRRPSDGLSRRTLATSPTTLFPRLVAGILHHLGTLLILLFLLLYTFLVGASASVVRACIMGALVILAREFGRQNDTLNALAFSALVMSLLNPYVLWDVGFQLSFLATLGLVVYAPRIQNAIEVPLKPRVGDARFQLILRFLQEGLIITAAAFLVTAPLLVVYFHKLSWVGFLTNFLVLPMQPPIMLLGGGAAVLQLCANATAGLPLVPLLLGGLAQVIAWGAYVCLQYTILVVQASAAVPYGSFEIARLDAPLVILFYAALAFVTWFGVSRTLRLFASRVWVPITVLAVATIFVWTTTLDAPDGNTHLTFIAAGEGDATFIRTAQDDRILINGTAEPNTLASFLGTQLPPWDRRIDLVVTTHLDDANLSALNSILERYPVGQVLEPDTPPHTGVSYPKWRAVIEKNQLNVIPAEKGTTVRAGDVTLRVIYPDAEANPAAVALRLDSNGQKFLFAPGLASADRLNLVKDSALFHADVAVLPNQIEKGWVERITPSTVILFVGRKPNDQPPADTLNLLGNIEVLRTDESGTITLVLNGTDVNVETAK